MQPLPKNAGFKCGRVPSDPGAETLKFVDYLVAGGSAPDVCHNVIGPNGKSTVKQWMGYWNHHYGTCVPSGMLHRIQAWSRGKYTPPNDQALVIYHDLSGFNLTTHTPDNGCSMIGANNYERSVGIGLDRWKTTGWMTINPFIQDRNPIKHAIWQLGAIQIGFMVANYVFDLWAKHEPWTNISGTTIDGIWGHSVSIFGYDNDWLYFVNVDRPTRMSWDFFFKYVDEIYSYTTPLWTPRGSGFDTVAFEADFKRQHAA